MITGSGALGCAACQASSAASRDASVFASLMSALASASRGLVVNSVTLMLPTRASVRAFPA